MRKTVKQLLIVVIIPTIIWATSLLFLLGYWEVIIQTVSDVSNTHIIFPFWVALIVLLIIYIAAMLIIYLLVLTQEIKEKYGIKI
jgi:hypothetical protein